MNEAEKERLIKKDIASIENRVRHAFNQGYEMGMKAYREQGGDAISRQAVIDRINKQREGLEPEIYPQDKIGDRAYRICIEFIKNDLPSVTPQQRTGRWIKSDSYGDQYNYYQSYVCSCCKREYEVKDFNYCPNCGCKMEVENG